MRHSGWVLGFHGCDADVGEEILSGKSEIGISQNSYDWLGSGAYFWENSYNRALDWAEFVKQNPKASRHKVTGPFVVGAIIDPGNCLDLSEARCLKILKAAYPEFAEAVQASGAPLPENKALRSGDHDLVSRKLDCAVINFLHRLRSQSMEVPFDTVRCPFMEGVPLYEGSKFSSRTHVQWCVRDPRKSIIAYFRPRGSD